MNYKWILLVWVSPLYFSCTTNTGLIGKWGKKQIIYPGVNLTKNIKESDWEYATMQFLQDSNLIVGLTTVKYDTVKYSVKDSMISITAKNGFVSQIKILSVNATELKTMEIIDSSIIVYRRFK